MFTHYLQSRQLFTPVPRVFALHLAHDFSCAVFLLCMGILIPSSLEKSSVVSSPYPNHLPAASFLLPGTYPTRVPEEVFPGSHQSSAQMWAPLHAWGTGSIMRLFSRLLDQFNHFLNLYFPLFKFSSVSKYIRTVQRDGNIESPRCLQMSLLCNDRVLGSKPLYSSREDAAGLFLVVTVLRPLVLRSFRRPYVFMGTSRVFCPSLFSAASGTILAAGLYSSGPWTDPSDTGCSLLQHLEMFFFSQFPVFSSLQFLVLTSRKFQQMLDLQIDPLCLSHTHYLPVILAVFREIFLIYLLIYLQNFF